jgi:hypothetical protein
VIRTRKKRRQLTRMLSRCAHGAHTKSSSRPIFRNNCSDDFTHTMQPSQLKYALHDGVISLIEKNLQEVES